MAAFAQAIAQGAEHVTVIADAVNSRDLAASGQLPDKLQQQALRKQAVAGASRLLNHLMRNVTSWPLQTADNQLPGIVITGYAGRWRWPAGCGRCRAATEWFHPHVRLCLPRRHKE